MPCHFAESDDPKRDWPEDFEHENGMYYNRCVQCNCIFLGYKRRVVCKVCFSGEQEGSEGRSPKKNSEGAEDENSNF